MMDSTATRQKRTATETTQQRRRSTHAIPWEWAYYGRHESVRPGHARFYAVAACYEWDLRRRSESPSRTAYRETAALFVLYRNPETDELVERRYEATTVLSEDGTLAVPDSNPDGEGRRSPGEWGRVRIRGLDVPIDGHVAVPTIVHDGEPRNFRASVDIPPTETRVEPGA